MSPARKGRKGAPGKKSETAVGSRGRPPRAPRGDVGHAARRQGANGKAPSSDFAWLRKAEVVIVNDLKIALALEYSPGGTPVVLGCVRGKAAEDVVWAAQALDIPLVELIALNASDAPAFTVGEEIPEMWYRPIAHALAILYKSTPAPELVRFLKPVGRKGRRASLSAAIAEFENVLSTPPAVVEIGAGLARHAADFEDPIAQMRQRLALEMGLLLPPIPLRPNAHLAENAYLIRLRDVPVQNGEIDLPIDSPDKLYLLGNRLKQLMYQQGWELLGYQEVEAQVELVRKKNPGLVRALFPQHFSLSALRQVLRNLLREQLSIRDLATILEVVLENLPRSQEPDLLTECVRIAYSRSLCHKYKDAEGYLNVLTFDPAVERVLRDALKDNGGVRWMDLSPDDALRVLQGIDDTLRQVTRLNMRPVILASPALRRFLARLVEDIFEDLPVLSYSEIAPLTEVRAVGTIRI